MAVIGVFGKDSASFLQSILSNDIKNFASAVQLHYALLLTPQGKLIADFFILPQDNGFLLGTYDGFVTQVINIFKMYRLRSDVAIEDLSSEYMVHYSPQLAVQHYPDPRNPQLGYVGIISKSEVLDSEENHHLEEYHRTRILMKLPDAGYDFTPEKFFPLELGLDMGISYTKGCYVGQEVTARTHYRGVVRKGVFSVQAKQPNVGLKLYEELFDGERAVGTALGFRPSGLGLALLRKELLNEVTSLHTAQGVEIKLLLY